MIDMDTDLNKNVMALLSENEKIVFLKTLLRLSARDGHIDETEIKHIKKTAQRYKVEDVKKIFENTTEDKLLFELKILKNRRAALELIKQMFCLAHADQDLSDEEILFIGRVAEVLGIEIKKVEQISSWVIDYYILKEQSRMIFESEDM